MSNKHIFDFLDYYVDLPQPPHFAVMLSGPWGIGKSYSVKGYLQTLKGRGKRIAYVSLYGIKSSDDIAIAILTALLAPKQDSKLVKVGGQLGRVLWRKLSMNDSGVLSDLIPEGWCDLIVLDDREKVIGMTFEFVEQSQEVLAHFIASTKDEAARTFLDTTSDVVLEIFAQSKTRNLRILDQSLRSWERVYKAITPALRKKEKGIAAAFRMFLALSLEVRAGRLGREDLTDRVDRIVSGDMSKRDAKVGKGTPLSEAQERYERIYLHDSILSDGVLAHVLCDGRIDPDAINASLSVHPLFVEPDEEPNWRKVWHGFLRDAQEFGQAFEALEKEFAERAHDDAGVVLHIMGLRLWGAEIGQLARSESEIVAECKVYIDDLRRSGRLPKYSPPRGFRDAAHGLAFHNGSTAAFDELLNYYTDQSQLAYQDTWPGLAQSLLPDMAGDGERFYRRICWAVGTSKPDCADDPILSKIAPASFVDKLLSCTPVAQRTILEGLKGRYEVGRLMQHLAAERTWIIEVSEELQRRLSGLPPIRRYSLSNDTARPERRVKCPN